MLTDTRPFTPSFPNAVRTDTIIVGAGPAGLAVGACLKQSNVPFIILEQHNRVGSAWHGHYDRLHLNTDKSNSELPDLRFPRDCSRYPSRLQLIEYLESYARHFGLKPRFGQQVTTVERMGHNWEVSTQDSLYRAPNVVIAAGNTREPNIPRWKGQELFRGTIIHSSKYRNGKAFSGKQVLVVGFGNSGAEIALDLWEHGLHPSVSVRSPVNVIPREYFGIPILSIGIVRRHLPIRLADAINSPILRAAIGDLGKYGLQRPPDGPVAQIHHDLRVPAIDNGAVKLIKNGWISIYTGIEKFTEDGVIFNDGRQVDFDAVILATGFRARVNAFLKAGSAVHNEDGTPCTSGRESALPGLYFCGYYVPPTGMLGEIAMEARRIGAAIARKRSASHASIQQNPHL